MKLRTLFTAVLAASLALGANPGEQLFQQGQKAERAGDIGLAYLLYSQAAATEPNNLTYWGRVQALRPRASLTKVTQGKPSELPAGPLDPTLFGSISDQELAQARQPLPPPQLKLPADRKDFDYRGDSKTLWEQLAAALHWMVVFDTQYQPTRPIHFQLSDVSYREAILALQAATNSFLSPVDSQMFLVANDTTQKRTELERSAAIVIPFTESETVQELQEIATSVRGALDIQRLLVDNQRKLILVRGGVTKVRLAQKLFEDLMRPRAQVAVDVEILSTDLASSLSYGLSLQTAFPLVNFATKTNLLNTIPSGFSNFMTFGGGASLIGFGVTSASLFANVSKSNTTSLLQTEVVAMDGLPSTLHVGDRYPLVSNQYIGNTTGQTGQVFTPPPTFTFEDLGLILKLTPHVHGTDEVSLDLDAEFKLLGAASVDNIPVISNKKFESKVRVMSGEWAVLAGLMTDTQARTITGFPILSLIPFLRSNTVTKEKAETVIVLKPHITVLPPSETPTWRAWTGTETRFATEL